MKNISNVTYGFAIILFAITATNSFGAQKILLKVIPCENISEEKIKYMNTEEIMENFKKCVNIIGSDTNKNNQYIESIKNKLELTEQNPWRDILHRDLPGFGVLALVVSLTASVAIIASALKEKDKQVAGVGTMLTLLSGWGIKKCIEVNAKKSEQMETAKAKRKELIAIEIQQIIDKMKTKITDT